MNVDESTIRQGLNEDEFRLHYQPIVSMDEVRVAGIEALIRWRHPNEGLLGPADFLPVIEDQEMLVPMGQWVLNRCLVEWDDWLNNDLVNESMFLSMNCSYEEISSLEFVRSLEQRFEQSNSLPSQFYLELKEETMEKLHDTRPEIVNRISSLNSVDLCVDNFGLNDPSMKRLAEWPTKVLKFDRRFVNPDNELEYHEAVVERLITFARDRGLTVIAEGLETRTQFENFYEWGCEYGQGFFLARPIDVDPSESLNEESLKTLVGTLGQRQESSNKSFPDNVQIRGHPQVLLAVPANPIREVLVHCLDYSEMRYQIASTTDDVKSRIGSYDDDIVIIDQVLIDSDELVSLIHSTWDKSPSTHFICLIDEDRSPKLDGLSDDERFEVLPKPIDRAEFLQVLSNQSYHLERLDRNQYQVAGISSRLLQNRVRFYLILLVGFTLIGLSLGYALTSLREKFSRIFQRSQTLNRKIEALEKSLEGREDLRKKLQNHENRMRESRK